MRIIDAFCGLGGWDTGAERTGQARCSVAINHSALALEWHERNHPHAIHVCQDLSEADFWPFRRLIEGQMLIASPACQGFSSAGAPSRAGTGGNGHVSIGEAMRRSKRNRNTMHAVLAAAEVLSPSIILVENVAQVLDWQLFEHWLAGFEILGYQCRTHLLNASRYGCATDRTRAVITMSQRGPIELADHWADAPTVGSCLDADDHAGNRWRSISSCTDRVRSLIRTKQDQAGQQRGLLNNVGDGVRLRPLDGLAPTLTTKSGGQLMLVDGDRVRILNPRELARIMGWRDSEVQIPTARAKASTLIGNAIPVGLAHGVITQALAA